jgi:hypothetical protein
MKHYSQDKKKYDIEIIIWEFSWMNVGFWKKKISRSAHNVSISHQIQIVIFATNLIRAL